MSKHVFEIDSDGATHTGCIRELNEDRFLVQSDSGLFAVADGMGGHDGGELASNSIVENLKSIGVPSSARDLRARFEDRVTTANREIREIALRRNAGMIGSTLAALLTFEHQYACLWAGDSRIYMLRDGNLSQLSRDHTEVQDLLDRGLLTPEEAAISPRRNVITRAIGTFDNPTLDFTYGRIRAQDMFLICSDGLTAHVSDDEMRRVLSRHTAREACAILLRLTLDRGAVDNVTVVVVQFRNSPANVTRGRPGEWPGKM
ncbi:serine/threonine-protein phosphatase [Mesorhizobium sp. CGMCC 1.15528]|uniref:Serine/threonine-protein phosphatase n=1 Tax=Mesorhizobium zhangyense TaxID=1776730 RepID=A0A7C9VEK6_9HYPH|nr:protein phosphatase 2C domain-containing protein [Mesorhizobium zhangyense]NGN43429.1 serine/threonine-protein phosphatase [Mesorhizobium zhangyense]